MKESLGEGKGGGSADRGDSVGHGLVYLQYIMHFGLLDNDVLICQAMFTSVSPPAWLTSTGERTTVTRRKMNESASFPTRRNRFQSPGYKSFRPSVLFPPLCTRATTNLPAFPFNHPHHHLTTRTSPTIMPPVTRISRIPASGKIICYATIYCLPGKEPLLRSLMAAAQKMVSEQEREGVLTYRLTEAIDEREAFSCLSILVPEYAESR